MVKGVQWALNTVFCERYGSTPYHVRFGRAPRTALPSLASLTGHHWQVDVLDNKALRKKVQSVVEVQSQLHKEVLNNLSNFAFGEYVLVARVRCRGSTPNFLMTSTGPWCVVV